MYCIHAWLLHSHHVYHTHTHTHTHNNSEDEEKGSDCIPQFKTMQECFQKHPEMYSKYNDEDNKDEGPSEDNTSETLPTDSNGDYTSNESTATPVQETA